MQPPRYRSWLMKGIAVILAIALLGNGLAYFPKIYSLPAIQFLKKNRELSKNEHIQRYKQAVVTVNAKESKGTGFNIDARGLIVTNQHVVGDELTSLVGFMDGATRMADVIISDENIDIAILKIREDDDMDLDLPLLELGADTDWQPGNPIYVIGNPLFFNRIANEGIISGFMNLPGWVSPVIMIEAPIYHGNSGSPVFDEHGKVIAVVFATTKIEYENRMKKVGLAIPVQALLRHVE